MLNYRLSRFKPVKKKSRFVASGPFGGEYGTRTRYLLIANQMFYQMN